MCADVIIRNFNGKLDDIFSRVIYNIWLQKIRAGIPVIVGIVAKSAHGKSAFAEYAQQRLYELQGLDFANFVDTCILIKPQDYSPKMRKILFEKPYKDIFTVQMDEAKFLINSDSWQSFKNKATRTITSTSRTFKPMIFFILAQKRGDIEAKTRNSLDYYVEIYRAPDQKPHAKIYEVYESKDDFEQPEMKIRPIIVEIHHKNGDRQSIVPKFYYQMPKKEIWDQYRQMEQTSKQSEIINILDEMDRESIKLSGESTQNVKEYVAYLKNNPAELEKIGKLRNGIWKMDKKVAKRMGYTTQEFKEIEELLTTSISSFESKKEGETNAELIPDKTV